jgi:thiol-disulfide isomerase/thioredoxin
MSTPPFDGVQIVGLIGIVERKMPPSPARQFLVLLLCCTISPAMVFAKRVHDPSFKTLDGQSHKLSALRGQVVVVNFWATWCGPCQEELPRLSQIAASYSGKPVTFVFISIDDARDRAMIPSTLTKLHVDITSWVGADTDTLDSFGLGNIVPGTLILDDIGQPIARIMGEAREDDVRKPVDWLLAGRKGAPPQSLTKRY